MKNYLTSVISALITALLIGLIQAIFHIDLEFFAGWCACLAYETVRKYR